MVRVLALCRQFIYPKRYFDDSFLSWEEAKNKSSGYQADDILEKVVNAFLESQKKYDSYERDSVVFNDGQINWPLVAMIYWYITHYSKEVKILDFGGSLASQYFQNQKFLKVSNLKWLIIEQENFVAKANEIVKNNSISFHSNFIECLNSEKPNFALFGSSLQYLEKPYEILELLKYQDLKVLILDRIPTHQESKDIVTVQTVPRSIYKASYPSWIFSESKMKNFLSRDFDLLSIYDSIGGRQQTKKGLNFSWKGYIYIRKTSQ